MFRSTKQKSLPKDGKTFLLKFSTKNYSEITIRLVITFLPVLKE